MEDMIQVAVVIGRDRGVICAALVKDIPGDAEDYFQGSLDSLGGEIGILWLPSDIASKILVHGTSEQYYGDGYDAMTALLNANKTEVKMDENWVWYGDEESDDVVYCDFGICENRAIVNEYGEIETVPVSTGIDTVERCPVCFSCKEVWETGAQYGMFRAMRIIAKGANALKSEDDYTRNAVGVIVASVADAVYAQDDPGLE
jgi:hypothetical protein